jgi:hypothetical protein
MYSEEMGLVAHNSFVHANVELGVVGGAFFLGAFYLPLWSLYRLGSPGAGRTDLELCAVRPFLAAIVAGYGAGLLTLSRCYIVPTYMVVGIAAAFLRSAAAAPRGVAPRIGGRAAAGLAAANLAFIICVYILIKIAL